MDYGAFSSGLQIYKHSGLFLLALIQGHSTVMRQGDRNTEDGISKWYLLDFFQG